MCCTSRWVGFFNVNRWYIMLQYSTSLIVTILYSTKYSIFYEDFVDKVRLINNTSSEFSVTVVTVTLSVHLHCQKRVLSIVKQLYSFLTTSYCTSYFTFVVTPNK